MWALKISIKSLYSTSIYKTLWSFEVFLWTCVTSNPVSFPKNTSYKTVATTRVGWLPRTRETFTLSFDSPKTCGGRESYSPRYTPWLQLLHASHRLNTQPWDSCRPYRTLLPWGPFPLRIPSHPRDLWPSWSCHTKVHSLHMSPSSQSCSSKQKSFGNITDPIRILFWIFEEKKWWMGTVH